MKKIKIGDFTTAVTSENFLEYAHEMRRLRGRKPLPEDMTTDNLKISFNSEEYIDDTVNLAFLGHLDHDILIPYPSNAWMGSVLPDEFCQEIHCVNYFQKINGDCELTHALEDMYRILKPGGVVYIGVPNFKLILSKIVNANSEVESLKWEHFLFSRNVDERGLFYNQSICDFRRIRGRASFAGFSSATEDENYGGESEKFLTMDPDDFDLPGISKKTRKAFWKMHADDSIRRKKCIVGRCNAKAGQVEFKRQPSIYCRRHYRKAKQKLLEAQERALRIMVILKKGE